MTLDDMLLRLWIQYAQDNPQAQKIHQLLTSRGEAVRNDHIALRTLCNPRVNIDALARPFLARGYHECEQYVFPLKKLKAKHFEHEDPEKPKIFISGLLLEKFSISVQKTLLHCLDNIPAHHYQNHSLLFAGAPWQPLCYQIYQTLLAESEYAAWLYTYGFRANHFTVNVNALKTFTALSELNHFLKEQGVKLNQSGGEIKGTPQDFLEQSSTLAEKRTVDFIEGPQKIPSCYYEFAKRYTLPNGQLFQGFVTTSADKIFESTDTNTPTDHPEFRDLT